jgi:hypothetical protein
VAATFRMLGTKRIPYQPTALGHDARQLCLARLPSKDGKRNAIELLEVNVIVRHVCLFGSVLEHQRGGTKAVPARFSVLPFSGFLLRQDRTATLEWH